MLCPSDLLNSLQVTVAGFRFRVPGDITIPEFFPIKCAFDNPLDLLLKGSFVRRHPMMSSQVGTLGALFESWLLG